MPTLPRPTAAAAANIAQINNSRVVTVAGDIRIVAVPAIQTRSC